MDSLLSSANSYKINARISNVPLDECSFIRINDRIVPFFEESVSKDPDITSLIIFVQDWQFVYSLEKETERYNGAVQTFKIGSFDSFDNDKHSFRIPAGLENGHHSMVFQIMGGRGVLQRTERDFYYLGDTEFNYEGINVSLPGIANNPLLVSRGQVIFLETKLNFHDSLDPYVVWYNGRIKLAEGKYSEGMGSLLWGAPEQSNFYSLRAEVFPLGKMDNLSGYRRNAPLISVTSNAIDVNLISNVNPSLNQWYVFDGNLTDLIQPRPSSNEQRAILSQNRNKVRWMSSNGTYGLAAGAENQYYLSEVPFTVRDTWQLLFRFKPVSDGSLLQVNFKTNSNIALDLSITEEKLVLSLFDSSNIVSHSYNLPSESDDFITAGISISAAPRQISARINVLNDAVEQDELLRTPLFIEALGVHGLQVVLGQDNTAEQDVTAIWDEFALYNNPSMDIIAQEVKKEREDISPIYD